MTGHGMRTPVAMALLPAGLSWTSPASGAVILDLADVVGGGSGLGTGILGTGIHPVTGDHEASGGGATYSGDGSYHSVPSRAFVDGVFVPQGPTQLDGDPTHTYSFSTDGNAYDHVAFGPNDGSGGLATIAGVDHTTGGNTMIGLHANKGVTFDLDAIRAANSGLAVQRFTAVFGDDRFNAIDPGQGDSDFFVFVDGVLRSSQLDMALATAHPVDVGLAPGDRYLPLVATDGPSNAFESDRVVVGNPRLELVPEPAASVLFALTALAMGRRASRPWPRPGRTAWPGVGGTG